MLSSPGVSLPAILFLVDPPLHLPHPEGHWWQVSPLIHKSQPPGMAFVIFATLVPLPRQDEGESHVTDTSSP